MANIVETAREAGRFNTLIAAVDAAGLANTLAFEGPFTVFAPTDEAFAKLPPGTVDRLLENVPRLKEVLTYHVVPGKVISEDVIKLDHAPTVEGEDIPVHVESDGVHIGNAMLIMADVEADNGVIHVIDEVLIPKAE